ncbi:MAG: hypothetical protein FJ138_05830 [Deltaproteobacteria bacterium]|nr:hypothetical protein [Deltaproteobacteria bacterium]
MLLLNAALSLVLAGLIWVIQVVHYPLFALVGRAEHGAYHAAHVRRITWLVAPLMGAELLCALALWWAAPPPLLGAARAGAGLVGVIWASTALVQVPAHDRLARGWDAAAHARLVRSNWVRTAAWTVRAGGGVWGAWVGGLLSSGA